MALESREDVSTLSSLRQALAAWSNHTAPTLPPQVSAAITARRRSGRWPLWLDFLHQEYHDHAVPSDATQQAVRRRLESADFRPEAFALRSAPDLHARMSRAAALARLALGTAAHRIADNLADTLLANAFAEPGTATTRGEPASLGHNRQAVELPVLLVDPQQQDGLVLFLKLWRVPVGQFPSEHLHLVPAPASQLLYTDAQFNAALANTTTMLRAQLADSPSPPKEPFALVWDLRPYDGAKAPRPLHGVGGGSLGGALALAALYLVRDHLDPELGARLEGIDWPNVAVSAQLEADGFNLSTVDPPGFHAKFRAWQDFPGAPQTLFAHSHQPRVGNVPQHGAADVLALARCVAEHASDLDPAAARLFRRLQQSPPRLDQREDRELLRAVADRGLVRSVRGYLLHRAALCALGQGALFRRTRDDLLDLRFVQLTLTPKASEPLGDMVALQASPFPSLERLLTEAGLQDVNVWQITADPGAGKSTVLRHAEFSRACAALRDWPNFTAGAGNRPELWVAIPVDSLPPGTEKFGDWLHGRWSKDWYPRLPPLEGANGLLAQYRVRFAIDGLNEIADTGVSRETRVQGLVDWLDGLPDIAPPVFSVRRLEATHQLKGRERLHVVRDVELEPWGDKEIEDYCGCWNGPDDRKAGARLLEAIGNDDHVKQMCRLPLNIAAQCEMLAEGILQQPVRGCGALYTALLCVRLRREATSWVSDTSTFLQHRDKRFLQALQQDNTLLRDLPRLLPMLRAFTPVRGLIAQAWKLTEDGSTSLAVDSLGTPVPADGEGRESWLRAVANLDIAEETLDSRFRFLHQLLWQEYLVALELVHGALEAWPDFKAPPLPPLAEARASGQPLRHEVSRWEESVKLAIQLDTSPERWVHHLMDSNLGLAGRAAAARMQSVDGGMPDGLSGVLPALRQRLLQASRQHSGRRPLDLRLRVEAGEALGEVGDDLRYADMRRSPSEKPCLMPRRWIRVPAGTYDIGSTDGDDDEKPVTPVQLGSFEIAFAPVTNAEYRCFMQDGGYACSDWWPGEAAQAWWSGDNEDSDSIQFWRRRYASAQAATTPQALKALAQQEYHPSFAQQGERQLGTLRRWTEQQLKLWLQRHFAAKPHRQPAYWNDQAFNRSSQPVVGVSLYEAQAYCLWAERRTGWQLRLPREAEWEAAIRRESLPVSGGKAADLANIFESGLQRTSPAGVFPARAGDDGLVDGLGNVTEWTTSRYVHAGHRLEELMRTPERQFERRVPRAVRSGPWRGTAAFARAAFRLRIRPGDRGYDLGFRLLRVLPHS